MPARTASHGACWRCRRRSWLLAELGGPLDFCARDTERLLALLALSDEDLLRALAGRRRAELTRAYESFEQHDPSPLARVESVCRHDERFPRALRTPAGPHMLHAAGGAARLARLTAAPAVALIGSRRASEYGVQIARGLARGLSASGVTLIAGAGDGIAAAARTGALAAGGGTVAIRAGGLPADAPARGGPPGEQAGANGCVVAELPCGCSGRIWGGLAAERVAVGLAAVTVLVEAEDRPRELAAARLAGTLERVVAAVPGRVTSPLARGPHALLLEGAALVRQSEDVLELLSGMGVAQELIVRHARATPPLEPRLQHLLDRVGAGSDTPDRLTGEGIDPGEVLLGLGELELLGVLVRGAGGRYLPQA